MSKRNKFGDNICIGDTVRVNTTNSKYFGKEGVVVSYFFSGNGDLYGGLDIRLNGTQRMIKLVKDSVRVVSAIPTPNQVTYSTKDKKIYLVVCGDTKEVINNNVTKEEADETAKSYLDKDISKEILIYRAVERKSKKVVSEKI